MAEKKRIQLATAEDINKLNEDLTNKVDKSNIGFGHAHDVFGTWDFNDYKKSGFYRIHELPSYTNAPKNNIGSCGQLVVSKNGDTCTQVYYPYGRDTVAWRCFADSNTNVEWNYVDQCYENHLGKLDVNMDSISPILLTMKNGQHAVLEGLYKDTSNLPCGNIYYAHTVTYIGSSTTDMNDWSRGTWICSAWNNKNEIYMGTRNAGQSTITWKRFLNEDDLNPIKIVRWYKRLDFSSEQVVYIPPIDGYKKMAVNMACGDSNINLQLLQNNSVDDRTIVRARYDGYIRADLFVLITYCKDAEVEYRNIE